MKHTWIKTNRVNDIDPPIYECSECVITAIEKMETECKPDQFSKSKKTRQLRGYLSNNNGYFTKKT